MNHNVPPIPTQLVVSAAVALAGIIAYVAALLIEEEQREVQESQAGCDYQLWFRHFVFRYVGTMNDINIWDSSKLHQSLHDGTFEKNDFSFEVGSQVFNKLWFLVDGIYPELACFVKQSVSH
jgi:hypothetical protein